MIGSPARFRSEAGRDQRTPLMDAAIDDALETARDLKPRRAAPLHVPRELAVAALADRGAGRDRAARGANVGACCRRSVRSIRW